MRWYSEVGLTRASEMVKYLNKLNGESIPPEHIMYHHSDESGYTIYYFHSEKVPA